MFGMQKIHRKTCKNCYNIPVPTTIEYGNFRNHSSLNFTFLMNVLLATFHCLSNVKRMYIFAVQQPSPAQSAPSSTYTTTQLGHPVDDGTKAATWKETTKNLKQTQVGQFQPTAPCCQVDLKSLHLFKKVQFLFCPQHFGTCPLD